MQIRVEHLTPCCGDQPSLDTWDKNEARSVRCIHCGRQTESHFQREHAYEEWQILMRQAKRAQRTGAEP
jgi:Zn ribbon nucleic-acid-binding protein